MDTIISILAIVAGVIGIAGSILPGLPGTPVSWIGLLILYLSLSRLRRQLPRQRELWVPYAPEGFLTRSKDRSHERSFNTICASSLCRRESERSPPAAEESEQHSASA